MSKLISSFHYKNNFILDKAYFIECYDNTVIAQTFLSLYIKAIVFIVFGLTLILFTSINPYVAWFIFALGFLEIVSTYYRKSWWVMRQMFGRSAKANITIEITHDYIHTYSPFSDDKMLFQHLQAISASADGWLITYQGNRHYISNRCLSKQAQDFLKRQISKNSD